MKKILTTLLTSGALVMSALPAQAIPITQGGSFSALAVATGTTVTSTFKAPSTTAGGSTTAPQLVGFDSSLGTLDSVYLQLRGTQTLTTFLSYGNDNRSSNGILKGASTLDLRFFASGLPLPAVSVPGVSSLTAIASCIIGSVRTCTNTASTSSPLVVDLFGLPGTDLYAYFATNALPGLDLRVFVEANVINGVDASFGASSFANYQLNNIRLDLTYNYTPSITPPPPPPPGSVPEPATPVLLLLGLGLMFAASRRVRGVPFDRPGLNLA